MLLFLGDVKKLPGARTFPNFIFYLFGLQFICYIQTIDMKVDKSWYKIANVEIYFCFTKLQEGETHIYQRQKKTCHLYTQRYANDERQFYRQQTVARKISHRYLRSGKDFRPDDFLNFCEENAILCMYCINIFLELIIFFFTSSII